MSENEKFEQFMERVLARPLPQNPRSRVRILARELAEGATMGFWKTELMILEGNLKTSLVPNLGIYLQRRWNNQQPQWDLLEAQQYLDRRGDSIRWISPTAFELVNEAEPINIFISYRRKDSSAFALLILKTLKTSNLNAFVDIMLDPGEDWHEGLKERIQSYEHFVVLLGQATLTSEYVVKEIKWAQEAGCRIIPITHNGFKYEDQNASEIESLLKAKHTIPVLEESASGYNKALVDLLNCFGITP
ncbi:MAG: toll/interleukin-1 receptor domain-containing protein [Anaerolineae bacterium]|nr:toll/interleukin-1 receptor domain-containing protein [Anaerolineae bacterium]